MRNLKVTMDCGNGIIAEFSKNDTGISASYLDTDSGAEFATATMNGSSSVSELFEASARGQNAHYDLSLVLRYPEILGV